MDRQYIANKLIKLRGSRTQAEVASAIGVTPAAIAMYESGARIPSDDLKVKLANYYHKSVGSIFYAKSTNK